jgi:hypothetical protein
MSGLSGAFVGGLGACAFITYIVAPGETAAKSLGAALGPSETAPQVP